MRSYSVDLRTRVLEDCDQCGSTREVALKYRVSESWVRRLKQRRREHGEIAARQRRPNPPQWAAHSDQLRELVAQHPDATLRELRQRWSAAVSIATLARALRTLGFTFKKRSSALPSRIGLTFKSSVQCGAST